MPTRTIDSAQRVFERLQFQGKRAEIDEASLVYIIEEVVGADPRTVKHHLSFLIKHKLIMPKEGEQGIYLVDYDEIYAKML